MATLRTVFSFLLILFIFVVHVHSWIGHQPKKNEPEYRCIKFEDFAPDQYCKNLCIDHQHNDINVLVYLQDQKNRGAHSPKEDTCYYSWEYYAHWFCVGALVEKFIQETFMG